MIHFLVAEMDLELDSKLELGFAETNNRPVNAAGESDGCVYKCNDQSFDFYSCNGVLQVTLYFQSRPQGVFVSVDSLFKNLFTSRWLAIESEN